MPAREEMPSTIRRSSSKAQRTWSKAHDNAVKEYGEGRRSHQTAFAALKHTFEKKGDRWVEKDRKGPSDPRAARSPARGHRGGESFGGVDVMGSSKEELYERARKLGVRGRSRMSKQELARAIARKQ
jgi:ChaB/Rho termination factor, N-terminal domain